MTDDSHQTYRDLLAGYALGSLDPDEQSLLDSHLKTCAGCRAALRDYQTIGQGLLFVTPPRPPPAHLRGKLRARLDPRPDRRILRFPLSFARLAAGAAFVLLLALNLSTSLRLRELQAQQSVLFGQLQTSQTALVIASQPGGEAIPVSGQAGSGSFITRRDLNTGVLFVSAIPPLDPSQTYQVWLIDSNGVPVSVGLFRPEPGLTQVSVLIVSPETISHFQSLGVTIEPSGGVSQPTGPLAMGAEF
jgi:anti-sigma-K factor RskA